MRLAGLLQAAVLAVGLLTPPPALAVNPDEILADPVLEARARELSKILRCVMCRNQSIDDSNADIAHVMRQVLRERLVAGDTDEEVLAFLVDRYGTFVLLDPPVQPGTYLLWGGPAILLVIAVAGFSTLWRRRPVMAEAPELNPDDRALAAALLDEETRK